MPGMIRVVRCTNAERITYGQIHGGIEEGRFFYCKDTKIMWMGTSAGDAPVAATPDTYDFWAPDALPDTPSSQDDHFDDASLDVKWTEWDLGVPQMALSEAGHHAILTHSTEAAGRFRGMYQTLPAGDFTIATKASLISGAAVDSVASLCLFEDATNINADILILQFWHRGSGNLYRDIVCQRWSDYQTFSANYAGATVYPDTTNYLRIRRNGTNLYYEYGMDGVGWHRFYDHVQPFVPAHMGVATQNNNAGFDIYGYFDHFRYIASDQIGPLGKTITVNVP